MMPKEINKIPSATKEPPGDPLKVSETSKIQVSNQKVKEKQQKIPLSQLLMHCPRSSQTVPCDQCKIDVGDGQTHPRLICHCKHVVTLHESRSQNGVAHWKSGKCLFFFLQWSKDIKVFISIFISPLC